MQLVESKRSDEGVKKRFICHIGTGHVGEELARLERAAEYEKARQPEERQPQPGLLPIVVIA